MPPETAGTTKPPGTERISAFVDGVIAIIITIMVLELKAPAEAFATGSVHDVLTALGPKILVYALSFLVVAILLLNHHMLMRAAPYATNALYWWNACLLFWTSLIPLATAVLGDSPSAPLAVAFYGTVMCAVSVAFTFLHRCAACIGCADGRLDPLQEEIICKNMLFSAVYALSVPLAFVSIYAAMAIFVAVPAAYFFPEYVPRLGPR